MRIQKTTLWAVHAGLTLLTLGATAQAHDPCFWKNGSSPDRRVFESTEVGLKMIGVGVVGPIATGDPSIALAVPVGVVATPLGLVDDVVHMPQTVPPAVEKAARYPVRVIDTIVDLPQQAADRVMQKLQYCPPTCR